MDSEVALSVNADGELRAVQRELTRLLGVLGEWKFTFSSELELQAGVHGALLHERSRRADEGEWFDVERERALGESERVDFFVNDSIAVECKTRGPLIQVVDQLQRYLEHENVEGALLVTTKPEHARIPSTLCGKPVSVFVLSGGVN